MLVFAQELIRIPTVNPPGDCYAPCARVIGDALGADGLTVEYFQADDAQEHSARYPRLNVVARRGSARPCIHLNGHLDVVPAGSGWTRDPFAGEVDAGRLYGRGASDMKAGLAAARFAAVALARAGIELAGSIELSATVDEESGGWAGVAHLARIGRLTSAHVDAVIIPEPFGPSRICVGHRGVYWFEVTTRGRTAHGSMPFLGVSAIDHMDEVLHRLRTGLTPALQLRTTAMPVVPEAARRASLNVNAIVGGQPSDGTQSPCVADTCAAIFDRRFLEEESPDSVRGEIDDILREIARDVPDFQYALSDLLMFPPVRTPAASPLTAVLRGAVRDVLGSEAATVASPGTYDHKHVTRLGGIADCVAYGPGTLELSHQPDEWCAVDDMVRATQVLALSLLDLAGPLDLRRTGSD